MEETQNTNNLWVKEIGLEAPKGFKVSNNPITYKGNLQLEFSKGYSLPTIHKQSLWDNAYYNSHVHPNREVIDNITSEDIERWNSEENLEYKGSIDFKNIRNLPKTIQEHGILNVYTKDKVDSLVHKHPNKDLLDSITPGMLQGALLQILKDDGVDAATNENVFSALRTLLEISKNNDYLNNVFLSKVRPDTAQGKIKFRGGVEFGDYINSIHSGRGGAIDSAGNAELESLVLRSFLEVPELRYNQLTLIGEEVAIGAGGVIETVTPTTEGNYDITLKLEEGEMNPFAPLDIVKGIFHHENGFGTTWFSINTIEKQAPYTMNVSLRAGNAYPPKPFMNIARWGNFEDAERQSVIILSAKNGNIVMYDNIDNYDAGRVASQWGRKKGLEFLDNFEDLPIGDNDAVMYLRTLLYEDLIQVDYKGSVIKEHRDRGAWSLATAQNDPYIFSDKIEDEVWYEAEKFRVKVNETTAIPTRTSPDWTLILSIKDDIEDRYNDLKGELETYADTIGSGLQEQIDGVVDSWFYDYVPTNSNYPAEEWTTNILKDRHIGDTFTNVQPFVSEATTPHAGKSWRWVKDGSTYKWTSIADSDAVKALLEASKAQDTADGKRRVFTVTPKATDAYDVGDLWTNATAGTYSNDLLRCKTAKAKGSAFSISHWEKASKYTDDTKANEAKATADNAQDSANTANQAIGALSDTVGELEIGLINDTTLNLLEEQLRTIKIERDNTINAYNVLDSNTYLTGTAKSTLETRKGNFVSSVSAIVIALEDSIADGKLTQGELDIIHASLNGYNISYVAFQNAIEQARKAIEIEIDRIAKGYVDNIEIGGDNLFPLSQVSQPSSLTFHRTGFIVDKGYGFNTSLDVASLLEPNTDYMVSFDQELLSGTYGNNLGGSLRFNSTETGIVWWGNSGMKSVSIPFTTPSDLSDATIYIYATREGVVKFSNVQIVEGNTKVKWRPSSIDVQAEIADAKQVGLDAQNDLDNTKTTVNSLNAEWGEATQDGIIDDAERKAIGTTKKSVNESMAKVDATYNKLYNNQYLKDDSNYTPKSNLKDARDNIWLKKEALFTRIDAVLDKAKNFEIEKGLADTAFGVFDTHMGLYQKAVEDASESIQKALDKLSSDRVDNIEIGGRNLLLNTKNERSGRYNLTPVYLLTEKPIVGESYTLSGWFKFSEGKLKRIMALNAGGGGSLFAWTNDAWAYEEWFYFSRTFTWITNSPDSSSSDASIYIYGGANDSIYSYGKLIKLEKGTKATDWTPAPEDVDADIANAQTSANTANAELAKIANDNLLVPSEKQDVLKERNIIQGEYLVIIAQAGTYSIATANYTTAYNTLISYLSPLLSSMTTDSAIVGATFRTRFKDYYDAKVALLKLVSDATKGLVDDIPYEGRNLISTRLESWEVGTISGGGINESSTTVSRTIDFYPIKPGPHYLSINREITNNVFFYTEEKAHLEMSYSAVISKRAILVPDGAKFFKMVLRNYPQNGVPPIVSELDLKIERGTKATDWTPAPEDVQAEIDSIEIGGRNLIYGEFVNGSWYQNSIGNTSEDNYGRTKEVLPIEPDTTYVFSMKDGTVLTPERYAWLTYRNDANEWVGLINLQENKVVFKTPPTATKFTFTYNASFYTSYVGGDVLKNRLPQIQKGTKATDWTPAPEDVQADIEGAKSITIDISRQGSFKTYFKQVENDIVLEQPKKVSEVIGGVTVGGKKYVQCIATIYRGNEDVTDVALVRNANAIWFVNGVNVAQGGKVLNMSAEEFADGKDDDVQFQIDISNAKNWTND